jgi:hypothetical protein
MSYMNGRQIYDNFQEGPGPDGLAGGAAIVNEVATEYETRAREIRELVGRMESAWQGAAAGAAQRGAGPIGAEHELSGPSLATAQDLTNRQAASYTDAKNTVVPVPPRPELPNPIEVFTTPGEWPRFENQVDEYNTAAQHNVDVMDRYAGASGHNIRELPSSYGTLTDDQAGIGIDPGASTIDSEDSADTTGGDGGGGGGGSPAPGPAGRDSGGVSGGGAPTPTGGDTSGGAVTPDTGTTTPGGVAPNTVPPPVVVGTDSGAGPGRSPGLVTGVGVLAGPGGGAPGAVSDGGRAGGGSAGPRGGGGPRGGLLGGPGVGAEPLGAGRPATPAVNVAGATGRGGGPGMSGVPLGAAGRGRDGEDTERTRPAYLEGGDPDELFDSDEKTAPPAIGEDDD